MDDIDLYRCEESEAWWDGVTDSKPKVSVEYCCLLVKRFLEGM